MYIGIDLGTSSVKLLLMDKNGNIKNIISRDYPLIYPQDGWAEQDPTDWWIESKEGIKELIKGYEDEIKAISFSGQMHGLVVLDEDDEIIRPAMLWCDQRTEEECNYLNNVIGVEEISRLTGNIAITGFTLPKILWMKNNEIDKYKRIRKMMLPKDYLTYKLSGVFATDVSDASGTLLLDVENRCWSKELAETLEIDIATLPKIYESYEEVGTLKEEVAKELGLSTNVKIVAGGGDQATGAVGVGATEEGIVSLALGTSGVVYSPANSYVVDSNNRLHSFCDATGGYHQMGVMLSASACMKWWVETVNKTKNYDEFFKNMDKANSDNLYFLPYLMGERTPHNDINARGTFIGLNPQHDAVDISKAVMEGVTFGLRDSLEILKDMNLKINKVRVSGGGAKNNVWKQIIADTFNIEVVTINSEEGPAFGAAILACVGDGIYKDVKTACKGLIREVEITKPEDIEKYNKKYEKFSLLYPVLKETFKELRI